MTKEQQAHLEREFATVINRMGLEKFSNTPDWVLARHLVWALLDFNATMVARDGGTLRPLPLELCCGPVPSPVKP